jgi:hypothetical protein
LVKVRVQHPAIRIAQSPAPRGDASPYISNRMDPAVQCVQELRADVQNLRSKRRVQSILKFGVYCPEGEHLTKPVLSANPDAPAVKREAEEEWGLNPSGGECAHAERRPDAENRISRYGCCIFGTECCIRHRVREKAKAAEAALFPQGVSDMQAAADQAKARYLPTRRAEAVQMLRPMPCRMRA